MVSTPLIARYQLHAPFLFLSCWHLHKTIFLLLLPFFFFFLTTGLKGIKAFSSTLSNVPNAKYLAHLTHQTQKRTLIRYAKCTKII